MKETNLRMRVPLALLCVALSIPAMADEKKAGPQLSERGITTFIIQRATAPRQLKLQLLSHGLPVATVTIDVLSEDDQIVKYEPVSGETLIVEPMMSKQQVTFRTEHESMTSRFDPKAMQWKRTGSEAMYARVTPSVEIVGALMTDFAERGILRSPELLSAGAH
ncbi:MAG TPA: hypothetical protein VE974_22000 [Thermoanaerobaculia bacterium]|nr:hypothetical protein [Thermoanaerobaculia bacterium]